MLPLRKKALITSVTDYEEAYMKTIAAVFLMTLSAVAGAQINKCVDASGKVVGYGTECPAGTRSEQSSVRNTPAAAPAAPKQRTLAEQEAEFRKRQIEKQEAASKAEKKNAEAEQKRQACDQSQAYLRSLEAGQRITRTDPKTGERSFLGDADYPKEIASAQRAAAANCK